MRTMLPDANPGSLYPRDTAADQTGGDGELRIYLSYGSADVITDDVNRANLGSAGRIAAEDLNLRLSLVNSWTYEQRAAYVDHLAATILTYPDQFQPLTLKMAQDIYDANFPALENTDMQGFGSAVGDQLERAGSDVAALGNGILNLIHGIGTGIGSVGQGAANLGAASTWLLPAAGILLVFMFTQSSAAKVNRASWLK